MLDLLQYYFWVLCNGMKMRFRMVMIAHPGPGIGFHKQFMWQIIIPPTMSRTFHGLGQSRITDTFAGSICSPLGDRMNLRYSTVSMWNLHFFRLAYSPVVCRWRNTSWTWSQWSSKESKYTRMSSKYPTVHMSIKSPSTSLMNLWKAAGALESLNGITCHLYEP